jgi:hypothetical protein
MTVIDRARAARLVLDNPVFLHVVHKEINDATETSLSNPSLDIREANRLFVFCLRGILEKLKLEAQPQQVDTNG